MPLRCSWCDNELGADAFVGHRDRRIAHTLCGRCRESFVFQMGVPLQAFIDNLPAPIFLVDDDMNVKAANREASALLDATGGGMVPERPAGVVFDCAYAQLPQGCGRNIHCSGCAIRRSVFHTWETGESLIDVPATLRFARPGEALEAGLLVSTERMGDVIILRVERAARGA
jgi:hypothetical protein